MAALRHAFSNGEDFCTAKFHVKNGALQLSAADKSGTVLGCLQLISEESSGGDFQTEVDLPQLNGSLAAALHERAEREKVICDFNYDGHSLEVKISVAGNKIYRRVLFPPADEYRFPKTPNLDGAAVLQKLSASTFSDAVAAMEGIDAEELRICAEPNLLKIIPRNLVDNASAEFPCTSNGVGASTLISSKTIQRVGQFGFGHGTDAQEISTSFLDGSFCKVEYSLPRGTMTFWLASIIGED